MLRRATCFLTGYPVSAGKKMSRDHRSVAGERSAAAGTRKCCLGSNGGFG